jgi:hypothetical protein
MNLHSLLRGNRARANAFNKLSSRFFFTFFFSFFFFLKRTHYSKEGAKSLPRVFPSNSGFSISRRKRKKRENGEEPSYMFPKPHAFSFSTIVYIRAYKITKEKKK